MKHISSKIVVAWRARQRNTASWDSQAIHTAHERNFFFLWLSYYQNTMANGITDEDNP